MAKKEELSRFIKKKIKEDYTKAEIKEMLLKAGWEEQDVAEAFMFFENQKKDGMTTTQKVTYIIVALIVIGGIASILLFSPKLQDKRTTVDVVVIKDVKVSEQTIEERQEISEALAEREKIRQEVLNDSTISAKDVGKEIVRRMRQQ